MVNDCFNEVLKLIYIFGFSGLQKQITQETMLGLIN